MASTANTMSQANGASGNLTGSNTNQSSSSRSFSKGGNSYKTYEGGRKQSPMDNGARRNQQKAWTQGTNPITQSKPSYQSQNGSASQSKSTAPPKSMTSRETNTADNHANDRLTFLFATFIGLSASITVKNGDQYTGIVSGSVLEANETTVALKMVKRVNIEGGSQNGAESSSKYLGAAPHHSMVFDVKDIADISVDNVVAMESTKAQNGTPSGFRTDADISGNLAVRERNLQRWEPSADTNVDMSLESAANSTWDQFEVNERLFGTASTYDENLYTTKIDRSDPAYKRKEAEAARIAREIEGSAATNSHIREERGLAAENDYDEEEKYSGVRRDDAAFVPLQSGQANKYTPPARRAPAGQPTVAGAPVDPAIISSQIARPDSGSRKTPVSIPAATTAAPQAQDAKAKYAPAPISKEIEAKLAAMSKPAAGSNAAPAAKAKAAGPDNATANVEAEVLDSFRKFKDSEKARINDQRQKQLGRDRHVRLNELLKFSKSFKLDTPVPKDLVPILAKDPSKQEEIIEKAKRNHEEKVAALAAAASADKDKAASSAEQKPTSRVPSAPQEPSTGVASAPNDRQAYSRGRGQPFMPGAPQALRGGYAQGGRGTGLLGSRLADIQQQRKSGFGAPPLQPVPGPIDQSNISSPPKSTAVPTPTSAVSTKFNVKAMEFKPNPAASTFTPAPAPASVPAPAPATQTSSPPSTVPTRSASRAPSPSLIFGNRKPVPAAERPSIKNAFNSIKTMKQEAETHKTDYSVNGGIPQPYRTPPTWDIPPENVEKTYKDMYREQAARPTAPSVSPQHRSGSAHMPHQHQLPLHLQHGAPNMGGPHQGPHHLHPQAHHGGPQHFDDHRMHQSPQVFPSPRMQQNHMAYGSPMGPHAQLAYAPGMPSFYPGQGPQPGHMRPYPGGPQFVAPPGGPVGAPMMAHQQSNGPYMGMPPGAPYNPQMPMYSPSPSHVYPHMPAQPNSGYPSPSRGAPVMMHQGSQQGHHPQPMMYMNPGQHQNGYNQGGHVPQMRGGYQQPPYGQNSHQNHHYPHQPHRAPSNGGYNQQMPPQMPPANLPPQPAPATAAAPAAETEEAK